jgi:type IV pilus assembly protein PilB
VYEAHGCEHCNHGYKGRIGIYQVLPISEAMRGLILNGGNALAMAEQAKREGIADLRSAGLLKVRQGITSLAEIDRVTQE